MQGPVYDSDNLDDIPDDAPIVAYYDDGEPGTATTEQAKQKDRTEVLHCPEAWS